MIAVIADDFTGAAELAGIALRYGLTVELCVDEVKYNNADVLVLSTDSRSLNMAAALEKTAAALAEIIKLQPVFIYKKIDSVLRGYVVEELELQMKLTGRQKGMIMPANPLLGRTISNGEYFVNGVRINETGFANDPEFPVNSAFVTAILKDKAGVVRLNQSLPEKGMTVGEVSSFGDYDEWVSQLDENWALAGAGDYFTAWLHKKYQQKAPGVTQLQYPFLYVCGTAFSERKAAIKKIAEEKNAVCYIKNDNEAALVQQAAAVYKNQQALILAFDDAAAFKQSPADLRKTMAVITVKLVKENRVKELFIEGGSTAAAILQELDITSLEPVNELSRGVVRMRANDLYITVKPGSYPLPVEIIKMYE